MPDTEKVNKIAPLKINKESLGGVKDHSNSVVEVTKPTVNKTPKTPVHKTPGNDPSMSPSVYTVAASGANPLKIKLKTGGMSPVYSAADVMKSPAR